MSLDVLCDLPLAFQPVAFRIKRASEAWERRDAHALRRAVFCVEQGIFVGDDRDAWLASANRWWAPCAFMRPSPGCGGARAWRFTRRSGTWAASVPP